MERIIIGQVYLPGTSVMQNITGRLLSGPEGRAEFFEKEKGKMEYPVRQALLEAFGEFFGPTVTDLQLRWSAKAGCTMCPCSPGFHLSGMVDYSSHPLISEVFHNDSRNRMTFYVEANGTVSMRSHTRKWGRGRAKTYDQYQVCTLLTSFYKTPEKAKSTHWLPPAPGTQMHLPYAVI